MKKFFTLIAVLGILSSASMMAQDFPSDPGTLRVTLTLSAMDMTGDTIQGYAPEGSGAYDAGYSLTITAQNIPGYTFTQWSDQETAQTRQITLNESMELQAIYSHDQYIITFKNIDGQVISTDEYYYGDEVSVPDDPTIQSDAQYTFVFAGWNPQVTEVTGEQTYVAQFDTIINKYAIRFMDWDGETLLYQDSIAYGVLPAYQGETPARAATDEYTYSFKGWTPEIMAVTGDQTYQAEYESTTNRYSITFLNWNRDTLYSAILEYGVMAEYEGTDPAKEATAQFTYSFTGWNPELGEVTGEQTYTAMFDSIVNEYQVKFLDWDGQTVLYQTVLEYGVMPQYQGDEPSRESTAQYSYIFQGWDNEIVPVAGDQTYTAVYETIINKYAIRFLDWDEETVLYSDSLEYGAVPEYKGETPTRETVEGVVYTWTGWEPEIHAVEADENYIAQYSDQLQRFTLTITYGNAEPETRSVAWGTDTTLTAPTRTEEHFIRWTDGNTDNPRYVTITSDTTFTAEYGASYVDINVAANQWTFFCLPQMNEGGNWSEDMFITSELEGIKWGTYNGAVRAQAKSGWENTSDFNATQGYIIYSTKAGRLRLNVYPEHLMQSQLTVALQEYPAEYTENANWNFIGNPLYSTIGAANITASLEDASATIWNGTGYQNELLTAGDLSLQALQAFFIQTPAAGSIMFNSSAAGGAPARSINVEENSRIDIHATAGGYTDKTRVIFRNNSSLKYEAGRDASKFMTSTAPVQMYFLDVDNIQCAQMVRPAGEDAMRLGYMIRNAGEMEINMPVYAENYELYDALTDRSYDLSETVSIYSEAGTYNSRLSLRPIKRMPTAIDNGAAASSITKVILNGQLFLIRDGKMYSVQGLEVK